MLIYYMGNTIKHTADIFKALADETRLKIIKIIAAQGNNLCVGAITGYLSLSQPAVSQHLKVLKNAGLVEANRQGFHVHYKIISDALNSYGIDLSEFLSSFGGELNLHAKCEHKGNSEKCNELEGKE